MARIYNKKLESGGEVKSIRMECEVSSDTVKLAWAELIGELEQAADLGGDLLEVLRRRLSRWLGGWAIDFREKLTKDGADAHRHKDRRPRLDWWQKVVDLLGEARLSVQRDKPKLQSQAKWLFKTMRRLAGLIKLKIDQSGHDGAAFFADWLDRASALVQSQKYREESEIDFPDLNGWGRERISLADWLGDQEYCPDGTRVTR